MFIQKLAKPITLAFTKFFFIIFAVYFHACAHAQVLGNSSTLMQKVINELTVIGGLVVIMAIVTTK